MKGQLTFMYTRIPGYGKACAALLLAVVCISGVFAAPCPICSKWEGQTFHDAQVTKGGRCRTGTIPKGCIPSLNKSEDYCIRCLVTVRYNTPSGYRTCPKCFGKAEITDKVESSKTETTPAPTDNNPVQEKKAAKAADAPSVVLVEVKKCDTCDKDGKYVPIIECALCENGFNHKKDGDSFKCRVCGKVCKSRFAPCCVPDCPECGQKRGGKIDCPFCGGDKVITPMEEARNKEKVKKQDVPVDVKR